jgi:BirA family biotin operon repressor/biotin-[acetyl-CoA-carboxylase] ligase
MSQLVVKTEERFGRPFRHFTAAVSAEAMALAWARQEDAPQGATVLVDREVSPMGRRARLWPTPAEETLAFSVVLRPALPADDADAAWLVVGVGAAQGAERVANRPVGLMWPDSLVGERDEPLGMTKAEVQLGPGQVRSAVVTVRLDLERLAVGASGKDEVLDSALSAIDEVAKGIVGGATQAAAEYEARCRTLGRKVKLRLMPKGETRGVARRIDPKARLELESATGMVERITIDMLREIDVV